jgi:hypothetical protein
MNGVLTAVRSMVVHAVAAGQPGGDLLPLLYEVADDRDLPAAARDAEGRMAWRGRAGRRGTARWVRAWSKHGRETGINQGKEMVKYQVSTGEAFTSGRGLRGCASLGVVSTG